MQWDNEIDKEWRRDEREATREEMGMGPLGNEPFHSAVGPRGTN
jgi:hypothetical protein